MSLVEFQALGLTHTNIQNIFALHKSKESSPCLKGSNVRLVAPPGGQYFVYKFPVTIETCGSRSQSKLILFDTSVDTKDFIMDSMLLLSYKSTSVSTRGLCLEPSCTSQSGLDGVGDRKTEICQMNPHYQRLPPHEKTMCVASIVEKPRVEMEDVVNMEKIHTNRGT